MPYQAPDGNTYRVADAHVHIYKPKIADKASAAIGDFYRVPMEVPMPVSEVLEQKGSEVGCENYLVCSAATVVEQVGSINEFIAGECANHPSFVGLGTAHPDVADPDELVAQLLDLGLQGIKLHPDFQRFFIDDKRMIPIYQALQKHGLVAMFHVGDERYDFSAPEGLARVLEQVPGLRCHAAHFGCCRIWKRRPIVLAGAPVVYDTSSMLAWASPQEVLELIDALGVEKLMWGTDFPMWDHAEEMERFLALGLSPEQNRAILYDNFARFYLSQP